MNRQIDRKKIQLDSYQIDEQILDIQMNRYIDEQIYIYEQTDLKKNRQIVRQIDE